MLQTDVPAFVELSPSIKSSKLNRYSDEEKKFHCEEWKKSKLSMSEYCRRSGISISSLSIWINATKPVSIPASETNVLNSIQSVIEIVMPSGLKLRLAKTMTGDIVRFIKALELCI